MSKEPYDAKDKFLGMNHSTASARLKKMLFLDLLRELGRDKCYRCNETIETYVELSVDHKMPWLHVSKELFWDLNNIAFSHRKCNIVDRPFTINRPEGKNWCCSCKDFLLIECFSKDKSSFSGYRNKCKACIKEQRVTVRT